MKSRLAKLCAVALITAAVAGCGGGGGGGTTPTPPPSTSLGQAIAQAAATPSNDSSVNSSAPFTVLQSAGTAVVSLIDGVPVVKFTVFDSGAVKQNLTLSNVSFAIAKITPGSDGNPDQWTNYVSQVRNAGTLKGPNGEAPKLASAIRAVTDPKPAGSTQLAYNADGYYTYTFSAKITDPTWTATINNNVYTTNGVAFEPGKSHRIAIQLNYVNSAGQTVRVNPYFDFTFDANGNSVPVTTPIRKMVDVGTCNNCHGKLAPHGGNRVDTAFCVMCHNPGTQDVVSGNFLTFSNFVHSIHAGKRLAAAGIDYYIGADDFSDVGFPQDLRNCSTCHSATEVAVGSAKVVATPQGDNWKNTPSREACLSCHTNGPGSDWYALHYKLNNFQDPNAAATLLTNSACAGCHIAGTGLGSDRVHFNQVQVDAAKYKVNIASATYDAASRNVTVKYSVTDPTSGNAAYNLVTPDCTGSGSSLVCGSTTKFGNLRFYLGYQNLIGQPGPTDWTAWNNGGSGANAYLYKGTNDGSNNYTVTIPVPADVAGISQAAGSARVISIGQVKEPPLVLATSAEPRSVASTNPADFLNVGVQHTYADLALSGNPSPRRTIVSSDKCNVCHGLLGTASGSNTLGNAFHGGARNTVEACPVCHDANRASSGNVMTNGVALYESFQAKRFIHGIHSNAFRTYPFAHGNVVAGTFDKSGTLQSAGFFLADVTASVSGATKVAIPAGTAVAAGSTFDSIAAVMNAAKIAVGAPSTTTTAAAENYAEEVQWPDSNGINCNACHVNNSQYKDQSTVGAMVLKPAGVTDPLQWLAITPKAATCTSCHDGTSAKVGRVIDHVMQWGGAGFANLSTPAMTQAGTWQTIEVCDDCHAPGSGPAGIDRVHDVK
ncbi:MAG: OmcA/MtrC family decaheme c-type cytochrome [Gemmatimonadota bacterium]